MAMDPMPHRRAVLADMAALAAGLATGPAAAALIAPDDARLETARVRQTVAPGRVLSLYLALPAKAHGRRPAVMVVHDDHGLDEQARDIARRIALEGYVACAPDFLSRLGGTPSDAAAARIMIGALDPAETLADALACVHWLGANPPGRRIFTGKVGAIGVGWGGALVDRLARAAESDLAAAITYGAAAPAPASDGVVSPPTLLHLDDDPSSAGHDPAAAALAWARTTDLLKEHLR